MIQTPAPIFDEPVGVSVIESTVRPGRRAVTEVGKLRHALIYELLYPLTLIGFSGI